MPQVLIETKDTAAEKQAKQIDRETLERILDYKGNNEFNVKINYAQKTKDKWEEIDYIPENIDDMIEFASVYIFQIDDNFKGTGKSTPRFSGNESVDFTDGIHVIIEVTSPEYARFHKNFLSDKTPDKYLSEFTPSDIWPRTFSLHSGPDYGRLTHYLPVLELFLPKKEMKNLREMQEQYKG